MPLSISRRQFAFRAVTQVLGTGILGTIATGCGTILHPERKGQPAGDLDWSIVALDGIGLLLFLVPGVIAFAVDFNNGSIYLPAEEPSQASTKKNPAQKMARDRAREKSDEPGRKLVNVKTNSRQLTRGAVEHSIAQHTGRTIRLTDGEFVTHPLDDIDQFWEKHDRLNRS